MEEKTKKSEKTIHTSHLLKLPKYFRSKVETETCVSREQHLKIYEKKKKISKNGKKTHLATNISLNFFESPLFESDWVKKIENCEKL